MMFHVDFFFLHIFKFALFFSHRKSEISFFSQIPDLTFFALPEDDDECFESCFFIWMGVVLRLVSSMCSQLSRTVPWSWGKEYSTQTIWERNELKIKGKTVLISPQKLFDDMDQNSSLSHVGRGGKVCLHCSNSWEQTHCMQIKKRLKTKEPNTWK